MRERNDPVNPFSRRLHHFVRKACAAGLLMFLSGLPHLAGTAWAENDKATIETGEQVMDWGRVQGDHPSFAVARTAITASALPFTLDYNRDQYFWRDRDRFPSGEVKHFDWETLNLLALSFEYMGKVSGKTGFFGGVQVYSGFESGMSESVGVNVGGGLSYDVRPDLKVSAGGVLMLHRVHRPPYPILLLEWREPKAEGFSASVGFPENRLTYRFSTAFALNLIQTYEDNLYRLSDQSTADNGRFLETRNVIAGLFAERLLTKHLTGTFGVQYSIARSFVLYNDHAEREGSHTVGNSPGLTLSLRYAF